MSEERKVYIVETSDDLLESWFPMGVYLQREAAEDCAEALCHDDGYIRSVARVIEMKVADTGECQMDTDGLDSGHVRNSSAYEAGYRDGSVHYELDHCPACKNIADLQEALDENAKLRNQLHDQQDTAEHNFVRNAREYKRVCDENAKLRELLQVSLHDFRRIYDCDEQDGWKMVDAIDRMVIGMRKLGLDGGRTEQELRIGVD